MLELRNIDAGYNRRLVLKDVSVKIDTSAVTVIMGPNGAGKSTLLKVMYGLIRPVSGGIYFNDVEIRPQPAELVKKGVFMIPQGKRVFRNMTVLENIELAAHFWPKRFTFHNRLEEILIHFPDLKPRLNDLAGNLSGGQQQMVAIARGLINQPRFCSWMNRQSVCLPSLQQICLIKSKSSIPASAPVLSLWNIILRLCCRLLIMLIFWIRGRLSMKARPVPRLWIK